MKFNLDLVDNLNSDVIDEVALSTQNFLTSFAIDEAFSTKMALAFGNLIDTERAERLRQKWMTSDFEALPAIEIRSAAEINGANSAFSKPTNAIYLSQEFITQNLQNRQAITNVLLEEIGHFVDAQINVTDTFGDEGEVFAAVVQGVQLDELALQVLKVDGDTATITIDKEAIQVEENDGTTSLPLQFSLFEVGRRGGYGTGADFGSVQTGNADRSFEATTFFDIPGIKVEISAQEKEKIVNELKQKSNSELEKTFRDAIDPGGEVAQNLVDFFLNWNAGVKLTKVSKEIKTLTGVPGNTLRHDVGSDLSNELLSAIRRNKSALITPSGLDPGTEFYSYFSIFQLSLRQEVLKQISQNSKLDISKISLSSLSVPTINFPPYSLTDKLLKYAIGGVQGRALFVQDFKPQVENGLLEYEAKLRFVIYDDFGVDSTDIYPNLLRKVSKGIKGLDAQFVLQHGRPAAKPFINEVIVEVPITAKGIPVPNGFTLNNLLPDTTQGIQIFPLIKDGSTAPGFGNNPEIYYRIVVEGSSEEFNGKLTPDSSKIVELPSESYFTATFYQPATNLSTVIAGISAADGKPTFFSDAPLSGAIGVSNPIELYDFGGSDTDSDNIPDVGEFAIGTDFTVEDTDLDGISDAVEIEQGTDPVERLLVASVLNPVDEFLGKFQFAINDQIFGATGLPNTGNLNSDTQSFSSLSKNQLNGLPILGDVLTTSSEAQFLENLSTQIRARFNEKFGNAEQVSIREIQAAFFEVFGPGGLFGGQGILKDSTDPGEEIIREDIKLNREGSIFKFDFTLGGKNTFTASLPSEIGFSQLGLRLGGNAQASVDLDYTFDFGFGIDTATNEFFFDTSPEEDLSILLKPSLPTATATLGFLQVDAKDIGSQLEFSVDLGDGNDNELKIGELNSLSVTPEGYADIKLNLLSSIAGSAVLPQIGTDLNVHWDFIEGGLAPSVDFKNINLNLGSFINKFAGPILESVESVSEPFEPIIDTLNSPLPLIKSSLLDLAKGFKAGSNSSFDPETNGTKLTKSVSSVTLLT